MDWSTILIFLAVSGYVRCNTMPIETNALKYRNDTTPRLKQEDVADAVNDFGYKLLLTMMKQNKEENIVISPTSVAGLLAMTLLGTVGQTHQELAEVLGFSKDIIRSRINHERFGELLQDLNSNEFTSKTLYADAMFVDTQARLRDVFRGYLSRVYKGDALTVDFKKAVEVKDMINQWVNIHTESKIENFLQKTLPADTKAVLLSALYFNGQWEKTFMQNHTQKMPFQKPSGNIMADLMLNMGFFNYTQSLEDDLHMIAMKYNDSTTTMYVLKPILPRRLTLQELMNRLDSNKIEQMIDKMDETRCVIRFPKMDLKMNTKLENSLKALGVKALFTPGTANFALMVDNDTISNETMIDIDKRLNEEVTNDVDARAIENILNGLPNPGLHIDTVIHDVKLTINEYGTEAVAATSGLLARTARLFYADSPFYMFIRNERTKLITFSAVIYDPTN